MIQVDKALQIVLDSVGVMDKESIPILEARGRVLADDIVAPTDLPAFNFATISGYAVRSADVSRMVGGKPISLILDGEIAPGGECAGPLESGHAVRVSMGSPIPDEADSVLSEEHAVRETATKLSVYKAAKPGNNIRFKGEDIPGGSLVMAKNRTIRAADIGSLCENGLEKVNCFKIPKASFLTTSGIVNGNGSNYTGGTGNNSNRFALYSQLEEFGVEPVDLGVSEHDKDAIIEKIRDGLQYDLFVTSVGYSFDEFTYVKRMLEQAGMDIKFWRVAIKPATPIIFGTCNNKPVFCISGQPFSFLLVMEQFIRPALMKMKGTSIIKRTEVMAYLTKDLRSENNATSFIRGKVFPSERGFTVTPEFLKSSSVRALNDSNGLIVIPPNSGFLKAGSKVKVQVFADPLGLN